MPKPEILNTLDRCIDRLEAWADGARTTSKNMTDEDAKPWHNQEVNYTSLANQLKDVKERIGKEWPSRVSPSGNEE